jgi:phosphatidylserine/phosphatidylglycerophosphate/cardiolipin synthase-like enzyme
VEDIVDLVTTGPEVGGVTNRDTTVVVQDLFRRAEQSVLIAGYAIYQGQRVFKTLADRMLERPGMKVQMFLDIQRKMGDTSLSSEIIRGFTNRFRTSQWPSERPFPEIFYDPRSLSMEPEARAALHAKCIVVDDAEVFVSSANFTEAAQGKNIEVGLTLRSAAIANRITRFFHALLEHKRFERVL